MTEDQFNIIHLGKSGYCVAVDNADFEVLSAYKWRCNIRRGYRYAIRKSESGKMVYMHREILGLPHGDKTQGDHVNGNTLDNRRVNLRRATHSQNQYNRALQCNSKTGYKGVHRAPKGKYRVMIRYKGRQYVGGIFTDKEAAAHVYDAMAVRFFGEFARLNFP